MMKQLRLTMLLMLPLVACDDPAAPTLGETGQLQVRPAIVRALPGDHIELDAVGFSDDGTALATGAVEWATLDASVATVSADGRVEAVTPGWARIVAASRNGPQRDTAHVAVSLRLTDVSVGRDNACGLDEAGAAWCWGDGAWGVLGRGADLTSLTPGPVNGALTFDKVVAGDGITCGIASGSIYCWGATLSTICDDYEFGCHSPTLVNMPGSWSDIALGNRRGCATGASGVGCWDYRLHGSVSQSGVLRGPVAVGAYHTCGLDEDGRAYCWGRNTEGQLGSEIPPELCSNAYCPSTNSLLPVDTNARFTDISAGRSFTCGLTSEGSVLCWGQYGWDPGSEPGIVPVNMAGDVRFAAIDAGATHACGLTAQGRIYCWGTAAWTGALGEPTLPYEEVIAAPRLMGGDMTFTQVSAGDGVTCGTTDRGILCTGNGWALGQGRLTSTSTMVPLAPPGPLPSVISPSF